MSSFYFHKIFSVLCGFTVGEYIRNHRLTLAAQELCSTNMKVIDVAVKYGYDSPDSFARTFTKLDAETEFEKYRIVQDEKFMSDYDRFMLELEEQNK